MKRIYLAVLMFVLVLSVFVLGGCGKKAETPDTIGPSFMTGGKVYCNTGEDIPAEFESASIEGYIDSAVSLTEYPKKDGQTNLKYLVGSPFIKYEDGYAVKWDEEWRYFAPLNQ